MTEHELELLNKGRLLRDAGLVLLPLLTVMRENACARIINAHRSSSPQELPGAAAELSVLQDLITRISQNNKTTATREEKLYATE